ncbi:MAG: hypothetical protein ABIH11_06900 [Candidatus Altiarchaeota archaeon]
MRCTVTAILIAVAFTGLAFPACATDIDLESDQSYYYPGDCMILTGEIDVTGDCTLGNNPSLSITGPGILEEPGWVWELDEDTQECIEVEGCSECKVCSGGRECSEECGECLSGICSEECMSCMDECPADCGYCLTDTCGEPCQDCDTSDCNDECELVPQVGPISSDCLDCIDDACDIDCAPCLAACYEEDFDACLWDVCSGECGECYPTSGCQEDCEPEGQCDCPEPDAGEIAVNSACEGAGKTECCYGKCYDIDQKHCCGLDDDCEVLFCDKDSTDDEIFCCNNNKEIGRPDTCSDTACCEATTEMGILTSYDMWLYGNGHEPSGEVTLCDELGCQVIITSSDPADLVAVEGDFTITIDGVDYSLGATCNSIGADAVMCISDEVKKLWDGDTAFPDDKSFTCRFEGRSNECKFNDSIDGEIQDCSDPCEDACTSESGDEEASTRGVLNLEGASVSGETGFVSDCASNDDPEDQWKYEDGECKIGHSACIYQDDNGDCKKCMRFENCIQACKPYDPIMKLACENVLSHPNVRYGLSQEPQQSDMAAGLIMNAIQGAMSPNPADPSQSQELNSFCASDVLNGAENAVCRHLVCAFLSLARTVGLEGVQEFAYVNMETHGSHDVIVYEMDDGTLYVFDPLNGIEGPVSDFPWGMGLGGPGPSDKQCCAGNRCTPSGILNDCCDESKYCHIPDENPDFMMGGTYCLGFMEKCMQYGGLAYACKPEETPPAVYDCFGQDGEEGTQDDCPCPTSIPHPAGPPHPPLTIPGGGTCVDTGTEDDPGPGKCGCTGPVCILDGAFSVPPFQCTSDGVVEIGCAGPDGNIGTDDDCCLEGTACASEDDQQTGSIAGKTCEYAGDLEEPPEDEGGDE